MDMNLREARFKRQKTQWDLRKETGIHQSKLSLIERGYIPPSEEEKKKIAEALGLSEGEIKWVG
jgi:transcriptional regulator with XRE-family HTH domain